MREYVYKDAFFSLSTVEAAAARRDTGLTQYLEVGAAAAVQQTGAYLCFAICLGENEYSFWILLLLNWGIRLSFIFSGRVLAPSVIEFF